MTKEELLDQLEREATEALTFIYGPIHEDLTAAFWVQKGIEAMRGQLAELIDATDGCIILEVKWPGHSGEEEQQPY